MDDFERRFNNLADRYPGASAAWVQRTLYREMAVVEGGVAPLIDSSPQMYVDWATWILESPTFDQYFDDDGHINRKLHLIKDVRAATHMSLKESKDAVDHAELMAIRGDVKKIRSLREERMKWDAERLDQEVQEVIQQLMGGAGDG